MCTKGIVVKCLSIPLISPLSTSWSTNEQHPNQTLGKTQLTRDWHLAWHSINIRSIISRLFDQLICLDQKLVDWLLTEMWIKYRLTVNRDANGGQLRVSTKGTDELSTTNDLSIHDPAWIYMYIDCNHWNLHWSKPLTPTELILTCQKLTEVLIFLVSKCFRLFMLLD